MIKINSLFDKEIISIVDGARMGDIKDIEIDESTGNITALIISGRLRLFGLFGRKEGTIIPWQNVRVIGDETILVDSFNKTNANVTGENSQKTNNLISNFLN